MTRRIDTPTPKLYPCARHGCAERATVVYQGATHPAIYGACEEHDPFAALERLALAVRDARRALRALEVRRVTTTTQLARIDTAADALYAVHLALRDDVPDVA